MLKVPACKVQGREVKKMFSVFVGTNKRNLSTSAVEAETNYIEGEVLEKIRGSPRKTPVFGMAYRDRLPQKLRFFFYNPHVEVTARHRKKNG